MFKFIWGLEAVSRIINAILLFIGMFLAIYVVLSNMLAFKPNGITWYGLFYFIVINAVKFSLRTIQNRK